MIEVLDIAPRHMKGTSGDGRNYEFYIQKVRVESVDRDGIVTAEVVEVQAQPGEVLNPGDDYLIDPTTLYASTTLDKKGYARKHLSIPRSPRLVRFADLASKLGYVKAPAVKAA